MSTLSDILSRFAQRQLPAAEPKSQPGSALLRPHGAGNIRHITVDKDGEATEATILFNTPRSHCRMRNDLPPSEAALSVFPNRARLSRYIPKETCAVLGNLNVWQCLHTTGEGVPDDVRIVDWTTAVIANDFLTMQSLTTDGRLTHQESHALYARVFRPETPDIQRRIICRRGDDAWKSKAAPLVKHEGPAGHGGHYSPITRWWVEPGGEYLVLHPMRPSDLRKDMQPLSMEEARALLLPIHGEARLKKETS